jgi:uncharacterized SAM-binding protein YcdF (DUF218 family)
VRILVVTSPYHVKRASITFQDAFGESAKLEVTGTPYESFPDKWWASQDATRNLLLELAKLTFYAVGGRFTASE